MKGRGLKLNQILLVVGLVVLFLLIMDFNNRMAQLSRLTAQREQVGVKATAVLQTQAALETAIAFATSDAAVEAWARQEGRMIQPGDQPVVPVPPPGARPVLTPTPVVTPEVVENWQVWLALFIESSP